MKWFFRRTHSPHGRPGSPGRRVGMGLDEHARPNARVRNLAANFRTIVEGIEHPATLDEARETAQRVQRQVRELARTPA